MDVKQVRSLGRIGPYQILERIGVGGMGEVFLAYDDRLDRKVAIKRIRPGTEGTLDRRERFRREARLAARLSHSAIVQVYDILQEDGTDYIVMEYVEGTTLRDLIRLGPLDVREVLELAREVAAGLEAAHRQGIIHRDLKTENVLVSASGGPKIMDFGIAKRLLDDEGEESLTVDNAVVGTCRAMSPEQARGEPLDHGTDLFALGVLLYEALTGISPFETESHLTTMTRVIVHRQSPARELNRAIPPQLSSLIDRLLEKDASLRPGSATEVRRELEMIAAGTGVSAEGLSPTVVATLVDLPAVPPGPASTTAPRPGPPRFVHLVLGSALPLLAAVALASFLLRSGTRDLSALTAPAAGLPPAGARSTFAVLRFRDRSATGEGNWMSTVFPEMITDLLAIDGRINGPARRDVPMAERDLRLAGLEGLGTFQQRLDVKYLIAGSYEVREDEKLVVRFLVLDRTGRRHLSEVLPGSASGLFQLSSGIADAIRRELRLPLLGAEGRKAVEAIYADLPPQAWPDYFGGLRSQHGSNPEKTAQLLTEAVALAPRSPLPGRALAQALRSTWRRADAARAACQARELAQRLPAHDRVETAALCHELSGRIAEALGLYQSLLRENPREQARYRLKIVDLDLSDRETDRMNDALNVLQDLRRAGPGTLRAVDLFSAQRQEAEILFQKDRFAEARRLAHEAAVRGGALHAFAQAADARRIEGLSLLQLRDFQGAVAPLQEACSRLAAARQERQTAICREGLVLAQFFADRTPRYDLIAENREIYRAAGKLEDVGRMIQLESILRQARGEHAEAERLSREAEALFTRIGAHRDLALTRLIMGGGLIFLGELQDARKILDQAYADLSREGETAYAAVALQSLGQAHFLRGDLRGARQAFEAAPSSESTRWLALIEAAEGRPERAAGVLKPLLTQEEARNPALAGQIAMDLAELRRTGGAVGEALAFARRAEKDLAGSEQRDLTTLAQLQLVKIHLAQKDFTTADERLEEVRQQAGKSLDYRVVLESGIAAARLKGLLGGWRRRDEALEDLAGIERGCVQKGNVIYAFEARLAACDLMRPPQKRERLEEIVREARRLGLEGIARRAETARGEG